MADASDVNRLLSASRAAHAEYRRAANPDTGKPNYPLAEQHVAKAHALLLQAHEEDPHHSATGWAELKAPYERLKAFYERYALIP